MTPIQQAIKAMQYADEQLLTAQFNRDRRRQYGHQNYRAVYTRDAQEKLRAAIARLEQA